MISRQMTRSFSSTFWVPSILYFIILYWHILFLYLKTFKTQFYGVPPLHYILVCKIHIYLPKMTFPKLLTKISFFYKRYANFWYLTCFTPNLILIYRQSHGLRFKWIESTYFTEAFIKFTIKVVVLDVCLKLT